jgi:hypothetical protein
VWREKKFRKENHKKMIHCHLLLFVLQVGASIIKAQGICEEINFPRGNFEHALIDVRNDDEVEQKAFEICKAKNIPNYRCTNILHELQLTMKEMELFEVDQAIVNVTFDRTLSFSIDAEQTIDKKLIIYPEENMYKTIKIFCDTYRFFENDCRNLISSVRDLVSKEWGCIKYKQSSSTMDNTDVRLIKVPLLLDGEQRVFETPYGKNPTLAVAKFCRRYNLAYDDCVKLLQLAEEMVGAKKEDNDGPIYFNSPRPNRLYPVSQRIYIELDWNESFKSHKAEEVCLYIDYGALPSYCGKLPLETPVYINPHRATLGHHILYVTEKPQEETQDSSSTKSSFQDDQLIVAVFMTVVQPSVEMLKIEPGQENNQVYLKAQIKTDFFDVQDKAHRLCILHNNDILRCMNPNQLLIEQQESHSTLLRAPIFNASSGEHELIVMLLNEYNKCFAMMKNPVTFNISLTSDVQPMVEDSMYFLSSPLFTTKNHLCPKSLSNQFQWLCELYQHEWGLYSQNGEDGILQAIFSKIGTTNEFYVEFGTEDGTECNTRYLREKKAWKGLLMDATHQNELINLKKEWINAENINQLFEKYQVPKNFDLLSIDIDFNDYWVLQAIDLNKFSPRVIVVEYNSHIPSNEARTVTYDPSRAWDFTSDYFGASAAAFYQFGVQKGYSLVYCESHGVNCFLVRNDALGTNISDVLMPKHVYSPTNFFGKGWKYPNWSLPEHTWEWI